MLQNLYKHNLDEKERQEIRRTRLLHQQKIKRLEQHDDQRHHKETQCNEQKGKSYKKKHKNHSIDNIDLQLSEWLKEKPDSFDDWLLVPCPKGQRCLVVAAKGETKMFSKNKSYRMTFASLLPGGGINGSNNETCILDCIYNKEMDLFFVLDAIHFSIPLIDCDAEFRFFWLKSKFNELNELEDMYKCDNLKSFKLLNYYDMSNEERLAMALQRCPLWLDNQPQLDGFLFYHKESHYVCGTTPLVCWLFPFMVPDVIQMTVSRFYESPVNYCKQNPWQYMNEFDKEMTLKQFKRKTKQLKELVQDESSSEYSTAMEEDQNSYFHNNMDKDKPLESLITRDKLLELEEDSY